MTIDAFLEKIAAADWFGRLGIADYENRNGYVQLVDFSEWAGVTEMRSNEPTPHILTKGMEWLPTTIDQSDPIHGTCLRDLSESLGLKEKQKQASMDAFRTTLKALRSFEGHRLLRVGGNDFTNAAKGAAAFTMRQAASELILSKEGFWCKCAEDYFFGHWPCGVMKDGAIVII